MKERDCFVIHKRKSFRLTAIKQQLHLMNNLSTARKQAYILCKILMHVLLYVRGIQKIELAKLCPVHMNLKMHRFFFNVNLQEGIIAIKKVNFKIMLSHEIYFKKSAR